MSSASPRPTRAAISISSPGRDRLASAARGSSVSLRGAGAACDPESSPKAGQYGFRARAGACHRAGRRAGPGGAPGMTAREFLGLRSIAPVSLGGTLVDKLTAISAAGFDGVEIFENDLFYFEGTAADVKRIADDRGLRIVLFQPFRDFEAGPREKLQRNLDRAERKFDLMG